VAVRIVIFAGAGKILSEGNAVMKSTVEQIRARFDQDVERFSNLETGQSATVDAPLVLDLISKAAAATSPRATHVLDIGCGAGNNALKLLQLLPHLNVTLVDLSQPMLERAAQRIRTAATGEVKTAQVDIRELALGEAQFDIILAAAVFHHLRGDDEWRAVFAKCYAALKPGGSLWISDLIEHSTATIQSLMWERYGEYLAQFKGEQYREQVFGYIVQEDTPRPLMFQIDMLREVGFREVEILHKNSVFAAFGAIK
jgi:tRNA (cmo5U34)-methyltransferase